jgi:hypothetical protein
VQTQKQKSSRQADDFEQAESSDFDCHMLAALIRARRQWRSSSLGNTAGNTAQTPAV